MHRSGLVFGAGVVCLILLSNRMTVPAQATNWVGWQNGMFETKSGSRQYVWAKAEFSQGLGWSASPPNGLTSLQYNPDSYMSRTF
jgi:hypothetical protein